MNDPEDQFLHYLMDEGIIEHKFLKGKEGFLITDKGKMIKDFLNQFEEIE